MPSALFFNSSLCRDTFTPLNSKKSLMQDYKKNPIALLVESK